jgi:hypothetical protein
MVVWAGLCLGSACSSEPNPLEDVQAQAGARAVATGGGPSGGTSAAGGAPAATGGSGTSGEPGTAGSAAEGGAKEDPNLLSSCDSNRVTTGGYWWSYADPFDIATVTPKASIAVPFAPESGSYDGSLGCHISGSVPGPLASSDERKDACGEQLYPAAGLGFGFSDGNAPYDITGKAGVSFVARAGQSDFSVRLSLAQTSTDIAFAEYADQFDSTCLCTQEAAAVGQVRSCFAHYGILLTLSAEWQRCTVFFADMAAPSWGQDQGLDPTKVLKLMWDMPQAPVGAVAIPFDVWVDDVRWITDEDVASSSGTDLPSTPGCEPLG